MQLSLIVGRNDAPLIAIGSASADDPSKPKEPPDRPMPARPPRPLGSDALDLSFPNYRSRCLEGLSSIQRDRKCRSGDSVGPMPRRPGRGTCQW